MVTEKKGLTKREKVMLLLLLVVGLFAIMVMYVIIPLYNSLEEKRAELINLQLEQSRVQAVMASEGNIGNNRNDVVNRFEFESNRYLPDSHSSEIGRMLNQLCQRYDLRWVDQVINDPKPFVMQNSENSAEDSIFLITSATMTTTGDFQRLKALLDAVEKIDYIRISSVSYVWNDDIEMPISDRIKIGFEVTMLKDESKAYDFSQDDDGTHDELLDLIPS